MLDIETEPDFETDGDGEIDLEPPERRRFPIWVPVVALLLVLVLAGGGVLALIFGGDDDEGPPDSITLPEVDTDALTLDAGGTELVGLLETGRAGTYHAVYTATGDPEVIGGDLTLEVWRRDGQLRQDSVLETPDGTVARTSGFLFGDRTVSCTQRDEDPWTCSEGATSNVDPDGVFGATRDQLSGVTVAARDENIDGRDVRCFDFGAADNPITMCVTADGIPVQLSSGNAEIALTELADSVDRDAFTPPAETQPAG